MKKKLLFLDGDGTLWYPKTTKRTQKPHWIYHDAFTKDNPLEHLELTPGTKETLEILSARGIRLVVISASPHTEDIAAKEIKERLDYFGLTNLFYSWHASAGSNPSGKAATMLDVIQELGLHKKDALMVGDSYFYDYRAAKDAEIDAFFIENSVARMPSTPPINVQSIKEVSELVNILK